MTIQDVSWVLEESPTTGNDRLVLIVIANHANKDQPWAYLTHDTIAHEARVSRATVIRCVARLEEVGAVAVRHSAGRKCNEYRLLREPLQPATVPDDPEPSQRPASTVAATVATDPANSRAGATQNHEPMEPKNLPTATPPAESPDEIARRIAAAWWESFTPRPAGSFIGLVKVLTPLTANWPEREVAAALRSFSVIPTRARVEELLRRHRGQSNGHPSTVTDRTAANVAAAVGMFTGQGR